jgi:hypothetical protein
MIRYTVRCTVAKGAPPVAEEWLAWLRDGHIAEVLDGGAQAAEIVRLDEDPAVYEIRYVFASRATLERYLRDHAPRLRAEGLRRFPPGCGLELARTVGEVIFEQGKL